MRARLDHTFLRAGGLALVAVLVAAAALASLSCARQRRTADDTLVYILDAAVEEVDPRWARTNNEMKVSRLVAPGLTSVDQLSMAPKMDLAESIEMKDPVTWEVTLRPDVRFPDGSPMTSRDVVYTFTSVLDPANRSGSHKAFLERYHAVEAIDERRVRFRLKKPLAMFLADLEFGIVSADAMAKSGGRLSRGHTLGAGPFRVVSIAPTEVVLERSEHWIGGAPPMKRIVFKTLADANARLLTLVGGSADVAQNTVRLDLVDHVAEKPRIAVVRAPSALLSYMLIKNDDPLLADVRVRRAIAHAIDRPTLVRTRFGGHAVLATGLLAPSHWAYEGDVARHDFDPALAMRLLDEAGFPDPDGDGPRPRLSLTYKTSADPYRVTIARSIAHQLGKVGIAVEVRAFEFATFFADVKKGNYQIATMQTGEVTEPDWHYAYFHSERIPTKENPDGQNRWRYRSDEADRLMIEGRSEMDPARRKLVYAELQKVIARDLPIIPLWHEDNVAVMNRDVKGFEVFPNARLSSLARVSKGDAPAPAASPVP